MHMNGFGLTMVLVSQQCNRGFLLIFTLAKYRVCKQFFTLISKDFP